MTSGDRTALIILCGIMTAGAGVVTVGHCARGPAPVVVVPEDARPFPPIDLNSAPWQEIALLPGIGETRAKQIIEYRERVGGLRAIGELEAISGISSGLIARIRDRCIVRRRAPGAGR